MFIVQNRAREAGCQGASGHGHRVLFANGGSPFFEQFFGTLFSPKPTIFDEKCVQNGTQNEVFWDLLFRESVKMEKCVWTAPACTDCI